jgi:hypothetical protein
VRVVAEGDDRELEPTNVIVRGQDIEAERRDPAQQQPARRILADGVGCTSVADDATGLAQRSTSIPKAFTLVVSCTAAEAIERLRVDRDVDVVAAMPAADAPRRRFLLWVEGEGFRMMKAPAEVRSPSDDLAAELQDLQVRGAIVRAGDARYEVRLEFAWRVSRLGYLSLWPFAFFVVVAWWIYGAVAVAVVVAGFVLVHWPRDVQVRRRELVSKLSDALGPVLFDPSTDEPYR